MNKTNKTVKKIFSLLMAVILCFLMIPLNTYADTTEWEEIMDTFTLEAVKQNIPDPGFAEAVFNAISYAIENDEYHIDKVNICDPEGYTALWPEPLTVEEILDSGVEENELVLALLENYVGPINACKKKITDITGFRLLKNTTSIDFQSNLIEDLSIFTGGVVAGSYNFNSNPTHMWPVTFPDTVRAATHSVATSFSITTAPLAYLFGEVVTPTLTYGVYYPDENGNLVLNTDWYSKSWSTSTAYGDTVPDYPQTNGTSSITLPKFKYEGAATIEIGLTGSKKIEDLDNWQANDSNAITYISGRNTKETGGTSGQGNSPSYKFGVQAQRYAKVVVETEISVIGGFKFVKTSAETGDALAGAEYTLYKDKACTEAVGSYTTDTNGTIEKTGLKAGTYYLKETKAPEGYTLNKDVVEVVIQKPEDQTTIEGGVQSFEHDATEPVVNAVWGTKTATTGEWDKQTATTTENATTLGADAILTNKGNVGYKKLSSFAVELKSDADKYDKKNVSIDVFMGETKYGTYSSDSEALSAINSIVNGKALTGDITVKYKCTFSEKEGVCSGSGEQTDKPVTIPTIWVENTTAEDEGGTINVVGFEDDTTSNISSDGEDNNSNNRKETNTVSGTPNKGWSVDIDNIYVTTRDGDKNYLKDYTPDNNGKYSIQYDDKTIVFTVKNVNGSVVVSVEDMDTDIDIGIPFVKNVPVSISGTKTLTENGENKAIAAGQFTFSLVESRDNDTTGYIGILSDPVSITSTGNFEFNSITFVKEGTYSFVVSEINGGKAGYTYDNKPVTVTLTIKVNEDDSSLCVDSVKYVKDGKNVTGVLFTNTYDIPQAVDVVVNGTKTLFGGGKKTLDIGVNQFGFTVTRTDKNGFVVTGVPSDTVYASAGTGSLNFGTWNFTKEGTYTFKISENDVSAGYTKAADIYVTVQITLNEETNTLDKTVYYKNANGDIVPLSFVNTYKEPVAVTANILGNKTLTGFDKSTSDIKANQFGFTVARTDGNGYEVKGLPSGTVYAEEGTGLLNFGSWSFAHEGTYTFKVSENAPAAGYTKGADVVVTIIVALDENTNTFTKEVKYSSGETLTVQNVYSAPATVNATINGNKTLTENGISKSITAGQFSFSIAASEDNNTAGYTGFEAKDTDVLEDGSFSFGNITFVKAGIYSFVVSEQNKGMAGYTYDTDAGKIIYKVNLDETTNSLYIDSVTYTKGESDADELTFNNTYKTPAPDEVTFGGQKHLSGNGKTDANIKESQFSFSVVAGTSSTENGYTGFTAKTVGCSVGGSFVFDTITFIKEGTYSFVITEEDLGVSGYAYDSNEIVATVVVTLDTNSNVLNAVVSYKKNGETVDVVSFSNVYSAPTSVSEEIKGIKTLTENGINKVITEGQFSFSIAAAEDNDTTGYTGFTAGDANVKADGTFTFGNITFAKTGIYSFIAIEQNKGAAGYIYDTDSVTVTYVVKLNEDTNALYVDKTTYTKNGADSDGITFNNTYTSPSSATIELVGNKEIDGQKDASDITEGQFTFEIVSDENNDTSGFSGLNNVVSVNNGGSINFGTLVFNKVGTYRFIITENDLGGNGYTYSDVVYLVDVTVVFDEETNKLNATYVVTSNEEEKETITFVNIYKGPTIWIENTTEDRKGGSVLVVGVDETKNNVSSGGTANNAEGRYENSLVSAVPDSGWYVDKGNIYVATRDGVKHYVKYIPANSNGEYVIEDEDKTITFTIAENSDGGVDINIEAMSFDIDVGVPFIRPELPQTGESCNITYLFVLVLLSVAGVFLSIKIRKIKTF